MNTITAKLDKMRKAQEFAVQPTDDGRILVQSDKSIGLFDFRTGNGLLNTRGCYFPHLSPVLGARRFVFPPEFVAACLDACPALDSITTYSADGTVLLAVDNTVRSL